MGEKRATGRSVLPSSSSSSTSTTSTTSTTTSTSTGSSSEESANKDATKVLWWSLPQQVFWNISNSRDSSSSTTNNMTGKINPVKGSSTMIRDVMNDIPLREPPVVISMDTPQSDDDDDKNYKMSKFMKKSNGTTMHHEFLSTPPPPAKTTTTSTSSSTGSTLQQRRQQQQQQQQQQQHRPRLLSSSSSERGERTSRDASASSRRKKLTRSSSNVPRDDSSYTSSPALPFLTTSSTRSLKKSGKRNMVHDSDDDDNDIIKNINNTMEIDNVDDGSEDSNNKAVVVDMDDEDDNEDEKRKIPPTSNRLYTHFPVLLTWQQRLHQVPPKYKLACFVLWILWKVVAMSILLYLTTGGASGSASGSSASTTFAAVAQVPIQETAALTSALGAFLHGFRGGAGGGNNHADAAVTAPKPIRVLYIVTTLSEYNTGGRRTRAGQDRLGEVLLPVLVDSVESMTMQTFEPNQQEYQVDVYIIAAYEMTRERRQVIRNRLPPTVGLEIWDDACPTGYDVKYHNGNIVTDNTRALSRQHRYVIKDKLEHYDLFVAFEDDMRVTGHHVHHFVRMSRALELLRQAAPDELPNDNNNNNNNKLDATEIIQQQQQRFFGPLTKRQIERLIPGFIRVEVLLNETYYGAQQELDPIPLDYKKTPRSLAQQGGNNNNNNNKDEEDEIHFNSHYCCHVHMQPNVETPVKPPKEDVVIWETNIRALSVRQLPTNTVVKASSSMSSSEVSSLLSLLDWVALLPGPGKRLDPSEMVGGYWSGRDGDFGSEPKPSAGMPDLIAQQGGWMATRLQILRMNHNHNNHKQENNKNNNNHAAVAAANADGDPENVDGDGDPENDEQGLCQGTFLPPFDAPIYRADGQESMNVEFWSGGYQFFTGVRGGCNMQRIVTLDTCTKDDDNGDAISKHFLYHVANNKQRQLSRRRMLRAEHLLGQLNTVLKRAMAAAAAAAPRF